MYEIIDWIIKNQLARRNVDNWIKINLSFRMEDYTSAKAKENLVKSAELTNTKIGNLTGLPKSANPLKSEIKRVDTREELSKIAGVSHDTIYKVKEIKSQTPVEILPDLESKIISHAVSINQWTNL